MIIGDSFVIGHIGKTGGDAIQEYCRLLPKRFCLEIDSLDEGRKHHTFSRRQLLENVDLEGKARILSFRRLLPWLVSYHHQFLLQYEVPINREEMVKGRIPFFLLDQAARQWTYEPADRLLETYVDGPVSDWIRMEFLKDDFVRVILKYLPLSDQEAQAVRDCRFEKRAPYTRRLSAWFTPDEAEMAATANPLWSRLERQVYEEPA